MPTLTPTTGSVAVVVLATLLGCSTSWALDECPANFKALEQPQGKTSCQCPTAVGARDGSVWGTGVYTTDSSICAAAAHSGLIGKMGGPVTVVAMPGCPGYKGTLRHGVTSNDWGKYESSFSFPKLGIQSCPHVPPTTTGDANPSLAAQYRVGQKVLCRWKAGPTEYDGTVARVEAGRLFVNYDDGDRELIGPGLCRPWERKKTTPPARLDVIGDSEPNVAAQYRAKDRVLCKWQNGTSEYPAVVAVIVKGRLGVDYEDGSKEAIQPSLCRRQPRDYPGGRPVTGPPEPSRVYNFAKGVPVKCRWKGGETPYPGRVVGVWDGRLTIDYDDGGKEIISPSLCTRGR